MKESKPRKKLGMKKPADKKFKGKPRRDSREHSRHEGPKELYDITCAKCGEHDKVPFKPTSSKPILCGRCFGKDAKPRGRDDSRRPSRDGFKKDGFKRDGFKKDGFKRPEGNGKQFKELNEKLDRILAILEDDEF